MTVPRSSIPFKKRQAQQRRRQLIATLVALVILIGAWLFGRFNVTADYSSVVLGVLPGAQRFEQRDNGLFVGYQTDEAGNSVIVGYAMAGSATGYGGPLTLLVGTDIAGSIVGVHIVDNRETPNFFRQLETRQFYDQFAGKNYTNQFNFGSDIDGVSGATLSAEAVAQSIRTAVRDIAANAIEGAVIPPIQQDVKVGVPEVALLALFVVSFLLHRVKERPHVKKYGRWIVLMTGLLVLGFVLNKPFTLSNVITLLSGYWPDWHNNLYWFLLLGGIFLVTIVQGKNPYCSWFCPFGAAQELLGSLSGAKHYQPQGIYNKLRWLQRGLSFTAIVLGLALRQPGVASYEPFGTLFDLKGSWPQWVLLTLVLFGSLVIYRPFCNYLCPLDPVVDYIGEFRRLGKNLWRQRTKTEASSSSTQP
ncbi:MAG: 4Fe-4S binding protein [Anaerolineae bacterium]|nr:4Fe-4S binding protein [Anaerolineae bacterium]